MHPYVQTLSFYGLPVLCEILESLFLWRLFQQKIIRRYPFLGAYVCYDLIRTPALLAIAHFRPTVFPSLYWATDVPALLLQFLLFWAILCSLFVPNSTLRRLAWNTLGAACGFIFPAIAALGWSQVSIAHFSSASVLYALEQYSSLAQALPLLAIAAVAQYYRVPLGRNMRGLIFTFGPYLLVNATGFASYQVFRSFAPYLALVPGATYTGMIAIWLWTFWEYAPASDLAAIHLDAARSKAQWNHVWQTTLSAVRRGQN